ncbi:pleckstrin homology domain-containing family G member 1 isoform X6 [Alexandromys fortis]|nr:pleckstrin homology domain-containing family G member 1 isoform X6 [Microtus fortis]XP_049991668.1 pleckstrin homology domain-containing family G member 1 isoform X6 [Microtus fortis]XP_049991669.1 pleckstrin homology domain-containing family G member 1 isoform X6 [Microtus fortis]XP_049991670.1 pleckstrin homology domain-containing family G member 1 isoform X6 [Microtus fortis]XP_049991672.1 pleckstrin homology domain-containing family G member 1 isoform X6 [Microtus fortis]
MELSDSDRPISFSSTSSSASSRDSHGSIGSRMTLVSNSHLGLFRQDKEAGAIKLELIPARPFSSSELQRDTPSGPPNMDGVSERQPRTQWRVDTNGAPQTTADSDTSPKLLYVDRVVQEILETERTYVQDLKSIVEDYLACIRDQTKLPLGTEDRAALFGNIQDIYHFNSELLQDLENCENDPVAIAECFVSKSEEFHIYTQYCTNYPRSVAVLTECMRNKMLAKFFRERQETLKHSLPLGSYLLKPVQRILKYHLLLHEIENHLDKDTEGYDVVLDAIDTMQRVAWHINDMKRKHEHAVRLQEIQSLLTNWKGPDLTSFGELVLEGTFRIQRAKNERTLFLLDKLLLITKKRDDTFTYKADIPCGNLMLVEIITKEPLSFSVFDYKNPKIQHTVQAKSQQDKRLWVLHLKRLILENHAAKIPAKAKQAILEMDAIHHPGFCYSPEGQMKAPCGSKENPAPHRQRRKSEPSSRTRKVLKTSETAHDIQKVSREEGSSQVTSATPSPAQRNSQPSSATIVSMLRGGGAIRSLWTDPHIRQSLFPSRRSPQENDDDDDYQMFVPSFSSSDLNSARLCEENTSSRPCSWHLGLMEPAEISSSSHRIVRRASSAGESNTCPPEVRVRDSNGSRYYPAGELQHGPQLGGQGGMTPFGSSVELTIDDIDHVYDNISFEDLKLMVAKRDEAESSFPKSPRDSVRPKSTPELAFSKRQASHSTNSLYSKKEAAPSAQEASNQSVHELQVVEENIYDTIGLPDQPSLDFKCSTLKQPKRSTFLGLEADFACCDSLRPFISQDSLQLSEEDVSYPQGPSDTDYLSFLYDSPRCNLPIADKALSDKLSEEVDEIWNDLENYIKKNEDKARDRLLAAFPVSKDDVPERLYVESTRELSRDSGHASSMLSLPGSQAFLMPGQSRVARASRVNCSREDDLISTEGSFVSLNQLSLASGVPPVDSPYELANYSLPQTDPENSDLGMEATDKTKSRVFMMARQYSQKIKKANQLLKVRSPELEQPPPSQHKPIPKDLAAILEEKRQGGPAIGARIAEYSQLYDQIVFRETPPKGQKDGWPRTQEPSLHRPVSPSQAQRAGEDWLWHSPYSNGELADFCSQPEQDSKSKYPTLEAITKSIPRQLSAACSVPSLQESEPLLGSAQRCSVVVSQPHREDCQGYLYNSLGRKAVGAKLQPYSRPQSSSSILINKSLDSINYPSGTEKKPLLSLQKSSRGASQQDLLSGVVDSRQQDTGKRSDLTLQDSQKVLVVNRNLPLSAQVATQNYFSNFKETEGDEDDYVEIKSEEEEVGPDLSLSRGRKSDPNIPDPGCSGNICNHGTSCSLKEPVSGRLGLPPYLTACKDSDKLNDYLWRGPSPNQQNLVQSLREKFQCLSSSTFA